MFPVFAVGNICIAKFLRIARVVQAVLFTPRYTYAELFLFMFRELHKASYVTRIGCSLGDRTLNIN